MTEKLRINSDRLHQSLTELAEIGALPGGGVCRLAFTAEDKAGRDYVENRMRRLGLDVRIDGIGNMIGFRMGKKDTPVIMTGSHLDTVATGGCFDGCLGVLAGLEVFEVLAEQGISTEYPLALASFANEEGVRFRPDMMGSMMLSGDLELERARSSLGTDGTTLGENLERTGYADRADFRALPVHCYVELHIEQGRYWIPRVLRSLRSRVSRVSLGWNTRWPARRIMRVPRRCIDVAMPGTERERSSV